MNVNEGYQDRFSIINNSELLLSENVLVGWE